MLLGFRIENHPQQVGKRGAKDSVDERITPPAIFDPLNAEFGFTLDAAANRQNSKCREYYDIGGNGLAHSWQDYRVWCNPPYSDIRAWVEKAWAEYRAGCQIIVMLLPANRCEQRWWQDLIEPFRDGRGPLETRFYRGRFNFGLPDNPEGRFHSSPPFGCVLVIWRRPQSLHHLPNQLSNGNSPVSPDGFEVIDCGGCAPPVLVPADTSPPAGSGAAIAHIGGPAPMSFPFHGGGNSL